MSKRKRIISLLLLALVSTTASAVVKNNMETLIEQSQLYISHLGTSANVEIWNDNYNEEGWGYFSIVSNNNGVVRRLEYVRIKNGIIQQRKYDANGDDLWIEAQ